MSPTILFFGCTLLACFAASTCEWSYEGDDGPEHWAENYPDCAGAKQSPIDIGDVSSGEGQEISWGGYDVTPDSMTLANNGHSVVLTSESSTPTPMLTLADGKTYRLDSVHFHWGNDNSNGTEHTIRGQRFSLEQHAVHFGVDENDKDKNPTDIIVITTLYKASLLSYTKSNGLDFVLKFIDQVTDADAETKVDPFPWEKLIKPFSRHYFWYRGSLTTPPCTEAVTFFIREQVMHVAEKQMAAFRKVLDARGKPLSGNIRPLQRRNGRSVHFFKH